MVKIDHVVLVYGTEQFGSRKFYLHVGVFSYSNAFASGHSHFHFRSYCWAEVMEMLKTLNPTKVTIVQSSLDRRKVA